MLIKTSFYLGHRFTRIYADLFNYRLSVLIRVYNLFSFVDFISPSGEKDTFQWKWWGVCPS